jgi:GDPmannose 4,6-dehydratase
VQVNALGALRILESIKLLGLQSKIKFYQASTSELFGNSNKTKQSELTPFSPQSPYATSKLFAYWITKNYRDSYGMFAVNGILFNGSKTEHVLQRFFKVPHLPKKIFSR